MFSSCDDGPGPSVIFSLCVCVYSFHGMMNLRWSTECAVRLSNLFTGIVYFNSGGGVAPPPSLLILFLYVYAYTHLDTF